MSLTLLPYGLKGKIFRSAMPFSQFDPQGSLILDYQRERISVVVLLADDIQCRIETGLDLRAYYQTQGIQVVYLPITDFHVPSREELEKAVDAALDHARAGRNIVIHCFAGIGRTGMFSACLARRTFGMSGKDALLWVRTYLDQRAVETASQEQIVLDF